MGYHGWSQSDLARKLHVNKGSVSRWLDDGGMNQWHVYKLKQMQRKMEKEMAE